MSTPNLPSTHLAKTAADAQIKAMGEAGLILPEKARELSTAVGASNVLLQVATPPGKRYFGRIDTLLSVRMETPVSRARECLAKLGQQWESVHEKFHGFREKFFQVKAMRARAAQMRKKALALEDPTDQAVLEADANLEDARADKLHSEIAHGEASLRAELDRAQDQSQRYAIICKENGGKDFTEADFRNEEISYLLRSMLWHASQTANMRLYTGTGRPPPTRKQVLLKTDVLRYFGELGISVPEVQQEIEELIGMRSAFDSMTSPMEDPTKRNFEGHFNGWLERTSAKYIDRVKASVAANGIERLERIMGLIKPTEDDVGKDRRGEDIGRGSVIE